MSAESILLMVTGSRSFADAEAMKAVLSTTARVLHPTAEMTLLHGRARGADALAATTAAELGWQVRSRPAQWDQHTAACPDWHAGMPTCKMAGHRRNAEMLAEGPDLVVGFPMHPWRLSSATNRTDTSRGTWSTIKAALAAEITTLVWFQETIHTAQSLIRDEGAAPC